MIVSLFLAKKRHDKSQRTSANQASNEPGGRPNDELHEGTGMKLSSLPRFRQELLVNSVGAKNNMGSEGKGMKNIRKLSSCELPGMKKSVGQGQSKAGNLLASMCLGNNHLQKLCHSVAGESSL